MDDLEAAVRFLKELLPDVVGELEHWPSSTARTLPHFIASLFDLAGIDLLGHRVLLPARMAQALSDFVALAPEDQLRQLMQS